VSIVVFYCANHCDFQLHIDVQDLQEGILTGTVDELLKLSYIGSHPKCAKCKQGRVVSVDGSHEGVGLLFIVSRNFNGSAEQVFAS
jgi:hypothetical protein